jgi:drug/metabolite transporter (DMT)-like permease
MHSNEIKKSEAPIAPYLAFSTVCLIWGSTFLFIGLSNQVMPPMWALCQRLFLAGILLSVIMAIRQIPFPHGAALRAAIWYGIFDFAGNLALLYWGETKIPSGLAAVLYGMSPILSILMESAFGMEKLDPKRLGGAIVAVGGVGLIFWREIAFGQSPLAIAAVLGAVVTGTLGVIMLKRGPSQSPIGANAVGFFVGLPFVLAFSFIGHEAHPIPSTAGQLIPLLYLVIMGSLGAFVLFAWLLGRWKVSSASFVAVIVPIIAVILGVLVRHETLAPGSWVGAVIVLVATAFVLRSESKVAASE